MHATAEMWKLKDNLQKLVLTLHSVGVRGQTQVTRLGSWCLSGLSHLGSPTLIFLKQTLFCTIIVTVKLSKGAVNSHVLPALRVIVFQFLHISHQCGIFVIIRELTVAVTVTQNSQFPLGFILEIVHSTVLDKHRRMSTTVQSHNTVLFLPKSSVCQLFIPLSPQLLSTIGLFTVSTTLFCFCRSGD